MSQEQAVQSDTKNLPSPEEIEAGGFLVSVVNSGKQPSIKNWRKAGILAAEDFTQILCREQFGKRWRPRLIWFVKSDRLEAVVGGEKDRRSAGMKSHKSRIEWTVDFPDPMPLLQAAKYLVTTMVRVTRLRKSGVLTPVDRRDRNGITRDCYTIAALDYIKPCLGPTYQLLWYGVADVTDGHIWVLKKEVDENRSPVDFPEGFGYTSYKKIDLAEKRVDEVAAHGRAFTVPGLIREAHDKKSRFYKKRDRLTYGRVTTAIKNGTLPAIEIDGCIGPIITQEGVELFLRDEKPTEVEADFKTEYEIQQELVKLHPELCIADDDGKPKLFDSNGKPALLDGKPKLTLAIALEVSESLKKLVELKLIAKEEVKRERVITAAAAFERGANGKLVPSGVKPVSTIRVLDSYEWPKFLEFFELLDRQVAKAKNLAKDGKTKSEIKIALDSDGIVGGRLRRVLGRAGLTMSRKAWLAMVRAAKAKAQPIAGPTTSPPDKTATLDDANGRTRNDDEGRAAATTAARDAGDGDGQRASSAAEPKSKGGRPREAKVAEVGKYLYDRWIKGDKLAAIMTAAQAKFTRAKGYSPPKTEANVTELAQRYAEKYTKSTNRPK